MGIGGIGRAIIGKGASKAPKPATGLRIQSSLAGRPIPRGWGQGAVAPNLLWYGNFTSKKQTQGGKGLGLGGGKGGTTSFTYSAATVMAFCIGPITEFIRVWNGVSPQTLASLNLVPFLGSATQSPWGYLTNQPIQEWHSIPETGPYTIQVTYHTPFLTDNGIIDSQGNVFPGVTGVPDINQYFCDLSTGTYTFNSANAGGYVGISYTAGDQPSQALAYRHIATANAGPMDLGQSAELPNIRAEILFGKNTSIPTQPDSDASTIITDVLEETGFNPTWVGDFSNLTNYVCAAGLIVSPVLTDQQPANGFINDLLTACNATIVWSGSKLNVVPYGDTDITANGFTYAAPVAPEYLFNDTDFIRTPGADPVQCNRTRQADAYNSISISFLDRGNSYNPAIVNARNDAAITQFGARPQDPLTFNFFALPSAASMSAHLLLGRQAIRNTYSFSVGQEYMLLDPGDIVALTWPALGLTDQWVRITAINENSDGTLGFVVEEYLNGTGAAPIYNVQDHQGYNENRNVPPPPTNTPLLIATPYEIAQQLQITIGLSGGTGWGGADSFASTDDNTYNFQARQVGASRQGVLAADLPIGGDPDTVNTLTVDLSMSNGVLLSGTQDDADNNRTLCYVDGEFISFAGCTLIGASTYQLSYLRRGQFGTKITAHDAGSPFLRMDDQTTEITYDKTQIGQTVYVKPTAFNIWEAGEETLDQVTAIPYVLPGIPVPPDVTGFSAKQIGDVVSFSWNPVDDFALKGYDIGYHPVGPFSWTDFTLLTKSGAGTEMTNGSVPPGDWLFGIVAEDIAGQISENVGVFELTVVNNSDIIATYDYEPDWLVASGPSPSTGFVKHWTGILIPDSTVLASNGSGSGWNVTDNFVYLPVATSIYATPTTDIGFEDTVGLNFSILNFPGPGETTGLTPVFSVDPWVTGSDPNSYTPYTNGQLDLRFFRGSVTFSNVAGQVNYLSALEIAVDALPLKEQASNVTVASGAGTAITFPQAYHSTPFIFAQPVGGNLIPVITSPTNTGFNLQLYDHTNTSVGGSANWQSQGT